MPTSSLQLPLPMYLRQDELTQVTMPTSSLQLPLPMCLKQDELTQLTMPTSSQLQDGLTQIIMPTSSQLQNELSQTIMPTSSQLPVAKYLKQDELTQTIMPTSSQLHEPLKPDELTQTTMPTSSQLQDELTQTIMPTSSQLQDELTQTIMPTSSQFQNELTQLHEPLKQDELTQTTMPTSSQLQDELTQAIMPTSTQLHEPLRQDELTQIIMPTSSQLQDELTQTIMPTSSQLQYELTQLHEPLKQDEITQTIMPTSSQLSVPKYLKQDELTPSQLHVPKNLKEDKLIQPTMPTSCQLTEPKYQDDQLSSSPLPVPKNLKQDELAQTTMPTSSHLHVPKNLKQDELTQPTMPTSCQLIGPKYQDDQLSSSQLHVPKNLKQDELSSQHSVPKYLKQDELTEECKLLLSTLPQENGWVASKFYKYQGFWHPCRHLQGILSCQKHFEAQETDILLVTTPKSGTTWLKAIIFTLINRTHFQPWDTHHPLLSKNPHVLVPFLEIKLFLDHENPDLSLLKSPRLFSTHMPHISLPESVSDSKCKLVYLCRDPKDTLISLWCFTNKLRLEEMGSNSLEDCFEKFCGGVSLNGPFWEHILGYWEASLKNPKKVFFLKYEEMKDEPELHLRRLAEFLGCAFSSKEEEERMVEGILGICSFDNLSNLKVNKEGRLPTGEDFSAFFRKGGVGDWKNYLTMEMVERLDKICAEKFHGLGLKI